MELLRCFYKIVEFSCPECGIRFRDTASWMGDGGCKIIAGCYHKLKPLEFEIRFFSDDSVKAECVTTGAPLKVSVLYSDFHEIKRYTGD